MSFKMKYEIKQAYLTKPSKRRSGIKMPRVRFIVAHDTGNPGSTARNNITYYERSRDEMSASAHIFLDDKEILECIPALTGVPEKAWHVLYEKPKDNALYGGDSNDIAIGVEYCYGTNINATEAYKRYVWVLAYICYKFNLNPSKDIVGHHVLDPERKTDPVSGLKASGRTYQQLIIDIVTEYEECTKIDKPNIPVEDDNIMIILLDWQVKEAIELLNKLEKNKVNLDYSLWRSKFKSGKLTIQEWAGFNLAVLNRGVS